MSRTNTIDQITELLKSASLGWLLPNLRQDFVVWSNLIDSELFGKFADYLQSRPEITPEVFSPIKLALLLLDQIDAIAKDPTEVLDSIDARVLQSAIRSFSDKIFLEEHPQNLTATGYAALALANEYHSMNSWHGLVDAIQDRPGNQWLAPVVCLYGLTDKPASLLNALVQPGTTALRVKLAVHALLSNPIKPTDQIDLLLVMSNYGPFGEPLPARERTFLLRSLYEQRPQLAEDFCQQWINLHPGFSLKSSKDHYDPLEDLDQITENIFQVEVQKIVSNQHNLVELFIHEKELAQHLSKGLFLHYYLSTAKHQKDKLLFNEFSPSHDHKVQVDGQTNSSGEFSTYQAELALTIADQGNYDEACQLIPTGDTTLPDDPTTLYSVAKISEYMGDHARASSLADRIISMMSTKLTEKTYPIWGDHFSLVNFGKLLLELHKPDLAARIFYDAIRICPNDASLLSLLAQSLKFSRNYLESSEIYRVLACLYPEDVGNHREFAQSLESIDDWDSGLRVRSLIINLEKEKSTEPPKEDLYAYARCALFAKHNELTLSICNELLSGDPDDWRALIYSGKALLQNGEPEKGLESLSRAIQASPYQEDTWLALADAQKNIYSKDIVIDTLINATRAVQDSAQIHLTLGEIYLQDHTPSLALLELKSAQELSPDDPKILSLYGQALKNLGHLAECKQVLSKAYELEPSFPGLAQLYADVLVELSEYEQAIAPLETLINRKASHDIKPYMDYARCILTLNKNCTTKYPPMKALIALNEVIQIDPGFAEVRALIAETLAANGDYEIAFQAYREALDTSLIEDKTWLERLSYGFGCVASAIGKHDIAIAALQEASQVNASNPVIFKALSNAYMAANLPEDAIRSARNVLAVNGDDPDSLAWFASQVADLIQREKAEATNSSNSISNTALSEALNAFAKAIQLAPTRTDLLIQLGNFQSQIGALDEARVTFSSIADFDYASITDLKVASAYLSKIGDHSSAIKCLENGIFQDQNALSTHDASLYANLAREQVRNHDQSSAIDTLDVALARIPGNSLLISNKIDILLGLGQSIDALNCIETALKTSTDKNVNIDLLFLASKINRSIGDFSSAIKYAQRGINASWNDSSEDNFTTLPLQYLTQIAEIYRALIQPDQAYKIIDTAATPTASDKLYTEAYLDFICLHTELALDTRGQIRPEIQEIQPDPSNVYFSRLMSISSRLMNKAGNYKQAEQLYQIAVNSFTSYENRDKQSACSLPHPLYLTLYSMVEAGLDLCLWDQATSYAHRLSESLSQEPLPFLALARAIVQKAEFYNLCEIFEAKKHKPSSDATTKEALNLCKEYLDRVNVILKPYKDEFSSAGYELTEEVIYRWNTRADIAFKSYEDKFSDPIETLIDQRIPSDAVAMINYLHQVDLCAPDRNSITRIIKIARSYVRNPAVILQVALAIYDDNPADGLKSIQSVLEQNPSYRNSTIAFCNILLARIAGRLNQPEIAIKAVENAVGIWPDEPDWHILAARMYKQNSEIDGAIKHLLEATQLAPKNAKYHMELGETYLDNAYDDTRMLKLANKSLERAIDLEAQDIDGLILLASTQFLMDDLDQAEHNARTALYLNPKRPDAYRLLSEISIRNNDFQGAFEYANKAIQLNPKDIQSNLILARSLSALGRYEDALNKLDAMLLSEKRSVTLNLERVDVIRKINGARGGLNELKSLINSSPGEFKILYSLAKSYVEVGELENAINIAQRAIKARTNKTSSNELANMYLLVGQVLRQSGQLDQSIVHLTEAIQLAPDRLEPYLELGLARKERREYQQALQIFEQATAIDPDDPRALFQAGLALKESKDYRSSETMLRRAVNLAPHDLNIRRQLAAVVALNLVHNPRSGRSQG